MGEIFALMRIHREDDRLRNYRAGLIASATYNVAAAGSKRSVFMSPLDFFEGGKQTRRTRPVATDAVDEALNAELLRQFEEFQADFYAAKQQGRIRKK